MVGPVHQAEREADQEWIEQEVAVANATAIEAKAEGQSCRREDARQTGQADVRREQTDGQQDPAKASIRREKKDGIGAGKPA